MILILGSALVMGILYRYFGKQLDGELEKEASYLAYGVEQSGVNYLDTANYEPKDVAHFEYSWQWAYKDKFREAGLTAILGCGFDPGVTSIYTAYAAKHHFDEIHYLDIVDCNAGDHH